MTTPRTAKGRQTRDRIVDVAATLMSTHGVARTSLEEVGAAAEVGKSQLYHYFSDKDGLVGSVIERQIARVVDDRRLDELDDFAGWERWRDAVVTAKREMQGAGGCPIGSLANELADTDESSRRILDAGFERWEERFRAGLTAMVAHGVLRPDVDPEALATAMLASLQGGLLLSRLRRSVVPLEAALDSAIAHLRCHAA